MRYLVLENNRLNGSLPSTWGAFSDMVYANLASNNFTGSVPASWENWTKVGGASLTYVGLPLLMLPIACMAMTSCLFNAD